VVGEVAERSADPDDDPVAGLALDDDTFAVRELGCGVWLATYRLRKGEQGERLTRRASLWRETADGWLLV
jgi:hypothetical protein